MTALENELEFLTANAIHWQEWSARDYQLMHIWRDIDADDWKVAANEHAFDSARARNNLFKLIDLKTAALADERRRIDANRAYGGRRFLPFYDPSLAASIIAEDQRILKELISDPRITIEPKQCGD